MENVKFNVDDVLAQLQVASQVVNKKNTMPILDDFKIDVYGDRNAIAITSSDLETQVTLYAPIESASGNFTICVNAQRLVEILLKLGGRKVALNVNGENDEIVANYDGGKFKMTFERATEYPSCYSLSQDNSNSLTIHNARVIYDAINSTLFAVADDIIRPTMSGVYLDCTQQKLTAVGTDGKILVKYVDDTIDCAFSSGVILAQKPCAVLKNLIQRCEKPIEITFDDKLVQIVESTGFKMVCRMVEGRYPNYNNVIPTNFNETARVDRKSLLGALARMRVFSSTTEQIVLSFDDNMLKLFAQDLDFSMSAMEELECVYSGKEMKISFKASYLEPILRNIQTDEVVINLIDKAHAAVIEPYNNNEPTNVRMTSLVMPMMMETH